MNIKSIIDLALRESVFEFARASGAGGQNVNKVNSKAVLRWSVFESALPPEVLGLLLQKLQKQLTGEGELLVSSQETRDQIKNKAKCEQKLAEILQRALTKPKKRIPTKPSRAAKAKRLEQKHVHKEKKSARRKLTNWSD